MSEEKRKTRLAMRAREDETLGEETVALSGGREVRVVGVSPLLLADISNTVKIPKPPIKKTTTAGGVEETYVDTDDFEWQREAEEAGERRNKKNIDATLVLGLPDVELPEDDQWTTTPTLLGLDIPEDPFEQKLCYIRYELLKNAGDLKKVMMVIGRLSGVAEEDVEDAVDSFPSGSADDR